MRAGTTKAEARDLVIRAVVGRAQQISLEQVRVPATAADPNLIALDDALSALQQFDPRKAKALELRFFGGLSVGEAAEVLKVSPITIIRD